MTNKRNLIKTGASNITKEFSQYCTYVQCGDQTCYEYSSIGRTIVMKRCRVTNGLLNFLLDNRYNE